MGSFIDMNKKTGYNRNCRQQNGHAGILRGMVGRLRNCLRMDRKGTGVRFAYVERGDNKFM